MSAQASIILLGAGRALQFESKAAEAGIYPGHFVEQSADGSFLRCNENGTNGVALIAIEDSINGKTKDDAYANGATVYARALVSGMIVQAKLAPSAAAVAYKDSLCFDGDGGVKKATAFAQSGTTPFAVTAASVVKFKALEAVDNSANAETSVFIKVQVI